MYTPRHLHALRVARLMIAGFGWQCAQQMLQALHTGNRSLAWAILDARHAEIARARGMLEETLRILRATTAIIPPRAARVSGSARSRGLRVSEAAQAVGAQASTLRFWEEQGLVHPAREPHSRYRLYDPEHLHILRTIALLRKAHYPIEAIRTVLRQSAQGHPEQSLAAAEEQLKALAETTTRCVKATAALWEYLEAGG
jgi:DNA-binding transcriptional MerR regulator